MKHVLYQHFSDLYLKVVNRNVAIIETNNQHMGVLLGQDKFLNLVKRKTSGWMSTHITPHLAQHWYLGRFAIDPGEEIFFRPENPFMPE